MTDATAYLNRLVSGCGTAVMPADRSASPAPGWCLARSQSRTARTSGTAHVTPVFPPLPVPGVRP